MVTKYLLTILAVAIVGTLAESCKNPVAEPVEVFTSSDRTVLTQVAFIAEFTLKCDNPLPENYALYAEVDEKPLTAARVGENKYQVSWTQEPSKANAGIYIINVMDEEGWASLRRARRSDPDAIVEPLLSIDLRHHGSYSGPLVNSEVLATVISIFVAYTALRNKSKILA